MSTNSKVKWISGISVTTALAILMAYLTLSDRAETSGVEKTTVKKDVEAVTERVEKLEEGSESTHRILHGVGIDDGLVSAVNAIKSDMSHVKEDMKDMKEQSRIILQEIRKLK